VEHSETAPIHADRIERAPAFGTAEQNSSHESVARDRQPLERPVARSRFGSRELLDDLESGPVRPQSLYVIALFSLPVVFWHLWAATAGRRAVWGESANRRIGIALYAAMLFLLVTNSGSAGEFIYFQF
jgi:hypothetical protein